MQPMTSPQLHSVWSRQKEGGGGGNTTGVVSAADIIQTAEEHWNVSGSSVVAAWLAAIIVGIVIVTIFSSARGKDKYQLFLAPRVEAQVKRKKKWVHRSGVLSPEVPIVDKSYFGWLKPQLKIWWHEIWQPIRRTPVKEHDFKLLELIGLDAVTYIHFLRLMRWLFLTITIFAALPLTIANYYLNTHTEFGSELKTGEQFSKAAKEVDGEDAGEMAKNLLDNMLVFTAANVKGNGLWVHIGFEYAVTGFVIFFVRSFTSHYNSLVRKWIEMNTGEVSFKSLLITGFSIGTESEKTTTDGKKYTRKNTVLDVKNEVCEMLGIPERPGAHVKGPRCTVTVTYNNMSELSKRMERFKKDHFPEFERTMTTFMRRFKGYFGDGAVYASCMDRVMGRAEDIEKLTDRLGWKLETEKILIEEKQREARCDPKDEAHTYIQRGASITSAFVTFRTTKRAYAALKTFKAKRKFVNTIVGPEVQRAPRPRNIIWPNLDKVGISKHGYSWMGTIILLIVFGLNLIPLAAITILSNYEALLVYWPRAQKANRDSSFWRAVFSLLGGIIPPGISALFAYILPYIVRRLNKWSGALTRGQLDKTVVKQLYVWLLVFNFIIFSLMGIIWETFLTIKNDTETKTWNEIWRSLGDVPAKVTKAYISQSSYWLSWYPIRALMVVLQLLQIPRILLKLFETFTAKTASDIHELAKPTKFEFAIEYVHILFAMAVALVLTPLAPLVSMCSTIYFWAMSAVHYNHLKYVEDSKETDGKCWRIALNRLMAATVIMQILMTITIGLKTKTPLMIILAAIPIGLIVLIKYTEGEDDLFVKVSELVSEADIGSDSAIIPRYEHELLRTDWMPQFHYDKDDEEEYLKAKAQFPWMKPLFNQETPEEKKKNKMSEGFKNTRQKYRKNS